MFRLVFLKSYHETITRKTLLFSKSFSPSLEFCLSLWSYCQHFIIAATDWQTDGRTKYQLLKQGHKGVLKLDTNTNVYKYHTLLCTYFYLSTYVLIYAYIYTYDYIQLLLFIFAEKFQVFYFTLCLLLHSSDSMVLVIKCTVQNSYCHIFLW